MVAVITGMGIIGPGFSNLSQYLEVLKTKETMLQKEVYEGHNLYVGRVKAGEIKYYHKRASIYPRSVQMLLHACQEAVMMANVNIRDFKVAVIIGSSTGVVSDVFTEAAKMDRRNRVSPFAIGNINANTLSTSINAAFSINGLSYTLANSCTSGMDAVHLARIMLQANEADICIVGGSDAPICDPVLKGFLPLKILQTGAQSDPMFGPFSGKGFSLSEGAGVLIVEREDIAKQRSARIFSTIKKTTMTQDAVSPYLSDNLGTEMLRAVDECIEGELPSYISSQALGIVENDSIEASIYEKRFLPHGIPITSIKGAVGHAMGASPLFQIISGVLSINEQFIPPTIREGVSAFQHLPIHSRLQNQLVESVLVTSHGYGGNNGCAFISKGGG